MESKTQDSQAEGTGGGNVKHLWSYCGQEVAWKFSVPWLAG